MVVLARTVVEIPSLTENTNNTVAEIMLTCSVKYLYGVGVVCGHKLCQKITKQRTR